MSDKPQPGLLTFDQLLKMGETIADELLASRQATVNPSDMGMIMYTSGTTGFPKGAMLSEKGILNVAQIASDRYGIQPQDKFVNPMPLFHIAGITSCVLACLVKGSTLIQLIGFDPVKQLELIMNEKATISGGSSGHVNCAAKPPALCGRCI